MVQSKSRFYYQDSKGKLGSAGIVRHYWWKQIVHPFATIDPRIDPKLRRAASLAEEESHLRFPTAAVAVLEFDGDWPDLGPGHTRLLDFAVPDDM